MLRSDRLAKCAATFVVASLIGLQPASAVRCGGYPLIPSPLPLEQRPSSAKPDGIAFVGMVDKLETINKQPDMGLIYVKIHVSNVRTIRGDAPSRVVITTGPCSRPSAKVGEEVLVSGVFVGDAFVAD